MDEEKDRQDEDTEGNMPLRQPRGVSTGGTEEEDAEGQGKKLADEETEEEDSEGHRTRLPGVSPEGTEEDTEGQGFRRP